MLRSWRRYSSMNRSLSSTDDVSFQGKVTSFPEVSPMSLDKNVTGRPISLCEGSVENGWTTVQLPVRVLNQDGRRRATTPIESPHVGRHAQRRRRQARRGTRRRLALPPPCPLVAPSRAHHPAGPAAR